MIRIITKPFKEFFKLESASGLVLLFSAAIALVISNSEYANIYFETLNKYVSLGVSSFKLKLSVLHWINDVLMTIFFFLVSLEIKREMVQGELSNPKQALLPIIGAVGGMIVPALIYVLININSPETLKGWAIPSATDIAFSLGVLSLLGKRVPISLKIFLTALAIIDDLGAIVIILIPQDIKDKSKSLLLKLEHAISPYVAFGIMPLFAFANAGVSLDGIGFSALLNPEPLGIVCGLFIGKQIGVFGFSYLSVKFGFAEKPGNSNWLNFYAVAILTGIGFTMSLFVGNLAFETSQQYLDGVKIGVLVGSLLSTVVGYFLLALTTKK
ncbi:MAG: Na+/H+ antiporter NhaA [Pelagibacteraceae bacterium]